MSKVGPSTRNRYIISEMGATVVVPFAQPPLRADGSRAVLLLGDRLGSFDRGSRYAECAATTGGREQVAA